MGKRPASDTGNLETISGHPKSLLVDSGSKGHSASEQARIINTFIHSFSENLPVKQFALPDEPPYETINLLCGLLMKDFGKPNLPVANTLRDINNSFSNTSFYDTVNRLLDLHEKMQPNVELDELLKEIVDDTQPEFSNEKRPEFLAAILRAAPKGTGYVELAQNLEELNHDFRREMAARLEPALNAHIQAMPHDTYDEKKILAKWVNDELRRFDLAIKCPKTGNPALLVGDPGNHPEIGRFCIEIKGDDGKRKRTVNTPDLQHLELMEAAPRREALAEWHGKVRRQGGEAGRA